MEITPIYLDTISTILKPTVNISMSNNYLRNDKIITVYSTMLQNSESTQEQNISTVIALYNSDGTMKSYSASSIGAQIDSTEKLGSDIILPSDVTGMKLKVFTLEGTGVYSGSMIPLSSPCCIDDTKPTYGGGVSLVEVDEDEPLFIDDVVFPEYEDEFSVYDISYFYGNKHAYYEKIILPGETLTISGKVKNKKTTDANIGEAFYTQRDGQSTYVELSTWYKVKAGETRTVSWDVPSEWTAYPPESDPVYPSNWISDEGGLTTEHQDYFGDNIKTSVLVDKDTFIKGKIDTEDDIDCVKFVAQTTGYYEVAQIDGIELDCSLYAENLIDQTDPLNGFEEIASSEEISNGLLWGGTLEAGNTYAIRFTAAIPNETGDYTCSISVDTDGDGLVDVWEITKDINGDGIRDILGADPYKTDIFVEINWMKGFKPEQESLDIIENSFALSGAGYENKGINLHNVWGAEYLHIADINLSNISVLEDYFTDDLRKYAYHCAVFGDRYNLGNNTDNARTGIGEIKGQLLFVAMGSCNVGKNTDNNTEKLTVERAAGTYMHELGHNLGLEDGGTDDLIYKPNYLSIMNYFFQMDGLYFIDNPSAVKYDYSHHKLSTLDENHLIESDGFDKDGLTEGTGLGTYVKLINGKIDATGPISRMEYDFNQNGIIDTIPVKHQVDGDKNNYEELNGCNDWSILKFRVGKIGGKKSDYILGLVTLLDASEELPEELTYEEYLNNIESINN